jgi:hypothetical protein
MGEDLLVAVTEAMVALHRRQPPSQPGERQDAAAGR